MGYPARSTALENVTVSAPSRWRSATVSVIVAVAVFGVHLRWGGDAYGYVARACGAAVGIMAILSLQRSQRHQLPFLAFALGTFYLQFGLPTLLDQDLVGATGPIFLSPTSRTLAAVSAVIAAAGLVVGAHPGKSLGKLLAPALSRMMPSARVAQSPSGALMWTLVAVGTLLIVLLKRSAIPETLQYAVGLLAVPGVVQTILSERCVAFGSRWNRGLLMGYTLVAVAAGMMTGMLSSALRPLMILAILSWRSTGRLPVRYLIIGAFAIVVLNPAKQIFRQDVWSADDRRGEEVGIGERTRSWTNAVADTWTDKGASEASSNVESTMSRFSALIFVAQIFEWVPSHVPFSGTQRWQAIASAYVPRALWPEKPDLTRLYNGEYSLTFELLTPQALDTTAINLPQMADGYWAAGWLGVVFVAVMVGGVIGFFDGLSHGSHWGLLAVGVAFLSELQPEAHLASFVTGIPQRIFGAMVALWVLALFSWGVGGAGIQHSQPRATRVS